MKVTHMPEKTRVVIEQRESFVLEMTKQEAQLLLRIAMQTNGTFAHDWVLALKNAGLKDVDFPKLNGTVYGEGCKMISIDAYSWEKEVFNHE